MTKRLGSRYELGEILGEGGMGTVFEAHDQVTGNTVALKLLHRRLLAARKEFVTLFKREFHTLKQLSSPRVVEVFDFGVEDGQPYYTMELLRGQDLSDLAPVPWRRVCELMHDVAGGLALLHSRRWVLRDLSARNVRISEAGQAKLMDFGALARLGSTQESVIGTPPFIAPEACHHKPLDGRTDLFALGALGYYLLTGKHAYPARHVGQLRDIWRSTPRRPSLSVECPEALETLIYSLINPQVEARPPQAAEVIDRLRAMTGQQAADSDDAYRAYLHRPTLIDRDREILLGRKALLRAMRGRGAALSIEAPAGMGRSRLLDELSMEGTLLGAVVVQIRAHEGDRPWDTVSRLLSRLQATEPELSAHGLAGRQAALCPLSSPRPSTSTAPPDADGDGNGPSNGQTQQAFVEAMCKVAERRTLVLAIDDMQHCDRRSASALDGLALGLHGQRLVLIATYSTDEVAPRGGPAALLRQHAQVMSPSSLDPEATAQLYRTMFGDVRHIGELTRWSHKVAAGRPRDLVALAQELVDRRAIRHHDGKWSLPTELDNEALPQSLAEAFAERAKTVSHGAAEVALTLCIVNNPIDTASLVAYCPDLDETEVFGGLDELSQLNMLRVEGDEQALREPAIAEAFLSISTPDQLRARHLAVGQALESEGQNDAHGHLQRAWHLLSGGDDEHGLAETVAGLARMQETDAHLGKRQSHALLLAEQAWERIGGRPLDIVQVRLALLDCAFLFDHQLLPHCLPVLERLERDCGLDEVYRGEGEGTLAERVVAALGRAGERYAALDEHERAFNPVDSMIKLGSALLVAQAIYCTRFDIPKARYYASRFEPLTPLSATARLAHEAAEAAVDGLEGRPDVAIIRQSAVAEQTWKLLNPEGDAQEPSSFEHARLSALLATMDYLVGLRVMFTDPERALELAERIDRVAPARHRPGGAQIRMLTRYLMGDAVSIAASRQDYEHALVRYRNHGSGGVDATHRARTYRLGWDLLALKELGQDIEGLARSRPGYRAFLLTVRGHMHFVRGDYERALSQYQEAARLAPPGAHIGWAPATAGVVDSLVALGRAEEAEAALTEARRINEAERLDGSLAELTLVAAAKLQALAGDVAAAQSALQKAAVDRASRPRLLRVELAFAQLEVAAIADDADAFAQSARALEPLLEGAQSSVVAAARRLLGKARPATVATESTPHTDDPARVEVSTQLERCNSPAERSSCMLTLLTDCLGAERGYLFAWRDGALQFIAGPPPSTEPPEELVAALHAQVLSELDDEAATSTGFDEATAQVDGVFYRTVLLWANHDGEPTVAGVAALEHVDGEGLSEASWPTIAAVAEKLLTQEPDLEVLEPAQDRAS